MMDRILELEAKVEELQQLLGHDLEVLRTKKALKEAQRAALSANLDLQEAEYKLKTLTE